jgi:hypothetical protein
MAMNVLMIALKGNNEFEKRDPYFWFCLSAT